MRCRAFAGYPSYNSFGSSSYQRFKDLTGVCCSVANSYLLLIFKVKKNKKNVKHKTKSHIWLSRVTSVVIVKKQDGDKKYTYTYFTKFNNSTLKIS
jgi:hypothetical protein